MMVQNPGGFWRRLLGLLLDAIVVGVPLGILSYILTGESEGNTLTNLLSFLYYLILPVVWMGYTVGKRIVGVRIVKVDGGKVGIGTMLLRTFVTGLVYAVTLGIALIVSAFMVGLREDKRGIHDLIAGTYVTTDKPQ
ncbi:RDD family protein [Siminovitchia fortis]|uniref:RDD family protein n=1 Tax=Siminovitchia fortis TaxID=254758 RepID=A0A451GBQ1_9BACI|nr:RDD family protein [Siminovitchia fortis]RWR12457.1 RDD family protein [Siminovitchia fortis]WHY83507.1 RDD family protein [Siminovitchia fortis]